MFQFKRTITSCTTRDKFFKAKITDSGSCHVCELKQTVEHLFFRMSACPILLEHFYLLVGR